MPRPYAFLAGLILLASALPAAAGTRVVASIYPLAMVAHAVAKPDTEVKLLMPTAASTHTWQPGSNDLATLASADVVIWSGPEAEPWLAPHLAQPRESQRVITLSKLPGAVLRDQRLDTLLPPGIPAQRDPHLWLSTRNAALLARALGAHLGNTLAAEHFDAEMQRLRARLARRFAPVADMPLLVEHDAYGYLFDEIGLKNVSAVVIDPLQGPTQARVDALRERIARERIGCMIGTPGFEPWATQLLYSAGHGNLVPLDPQLAGPGLTRSSYTLALTYLADTLYGCLVTR